jgi:peptidoglycan-N-acetylglucosamine deacetylase
MISSVSLDLDNKWSYMKTHGDAGWETFPSYLPLVVPTILDVLQSLDIKITFFVVGQDAVLSENRESLEAIATAGHEIANHSFHHEPWLHEYSRERLIDEFDRSEAAILGATGVKPVGFRGPGFSYSKAVLEVLSQRGYRYDASTFPTFLGPIARAYYMLHSRLTGADRAQRKALFGSARAGFMSLRPYRWTSLGSQMIEIPVTTLPWVKVPIHFSYIMYLATFSKLLAKSYFQSAMTFCWINRIEPSLLLHPLDFLGCDAEPDLAYFPGMSLKTATKVELARDCLTGLSRMFEVGTMLDHVKAFEEREPPFRN